MALICAINTHSTLAKGSKPRAISNHEEGYHDEHGFHHGRTNYNANPHAAWNEPGYMGSEIAYPDVVERIAVPEILHDVNY